MVEARTPRRRSGLQQERSRQTRQRLVRAALELWADRGFENGIETTTVEEIVKVAGVTKGTFYFHFARKEEILFEMGWETAAVVNEEARRCVKAQRGLEESLSRLMATLTTRIRAAPPAGVARSVAEFQRRPRTDWGAGDRVGFDHGFELVFAQAQKDGELSTDIPASEMARILVALAMDAIVVYTASHSDLRASLNRRAAIVVGGLKIPAAISS
jgi:AcrR family transcriptional regulator